jgi:hypothetical protein
MELDRWQDCVMKQIMSGVARPHLNVESGRIGAVPPEPGDLQPRPCSSRSIFCSTGLLPHKRPILVYHLGELPTQSCRQSVSAPRRKAGARSNAHTKLQAQRQRSAREGIHRNRAIRCTRIHGLAASSSLAWPLVPGLLAQSELMNP